MYQGKNRTALASQRQIARALLGMMGEEAYDTISVAALCRRAGVSRQTFYSLFRSKENVVIYLLREDCCPEPLTETEGENVLRQLCQRYSRFVVHHREVLRLLAENGLISFLQDDMYEMLQSNNGFCSGFWESYRAYAAEFLAAGMARLTETFVRRGLDAGTIEEITYTLLRGDCKNP